MRPFPPSALTADAGIVATARYLIRMCELLPDVCDRAEISLNIDRLLIKLPYYPVAGFTDGLRRTLARAREQGILPFTAVDGVGRGFICDSRR